MNFGKHRFWAVLGAGVLLLSVALTGCAGAAPEQVATTPTAVPTETPKELPAATSATDKLSAESPVVIMAPTQDPERQKKLDAAAETPTKRPETAMTGSAPETKPETPAAAPEKDAPKAPETGAKTEVEEKPVDTPQANDSKEPAATPTATEEAQPTDVPDTAAPTDAPQPTEKPTYVPGVMVGSKVGNVSPEIDGIVAWINSEPLNMEELRGKVVLVDFWTYTCINCIRTMPFLKQWHSRYQDDGLVILGIHAPEFEFEKDLGNVTKAVNDYGIGWPVALDNDFRTWRNYSNRFWPAKYLIDKAGVVRYRHFGEGKYAETEEKIRELIEETGVDLSGAIHELPKDQTIDAAFLNNRGAYVTRELYAGYERGFGDLHFGQGGYVSQVDYYRNRDQTADFKLPNYLLPHQIYFNGPWHIGPEHVRHGRASEDYEDSISLVYSARSVNVVLTSASGEPYKVRVTADGEYLTEDTKGADVTIGEDGESYILVTEPKMYNIVENPSYVDGETLVMSSMSPDFGLFAFTFGVYQKAAS